MNYIDSKINDTSKLIIMGDWNHARIRKKYIQGQHPQYFYNYQKIRNDLSMRDMVMGINIEAGHSIHSYKGYLAIDHIAIGKYFLFNDNPKYSNYNIDADIGTPDHAYLYAEIVPLT